MEREESGPEHDPLVGRVERLEKRMARFEENLRRFPVRSSETPDADA